MPEPSGRTQRRAARARRDWATIERALLGSALIAYSAFVWFSSARIEGRRTWTLFDDAMISLRYARNLSEGHGLVFNQGENVEGYTNLGWTLILALVHTVVSDRHLVAGFVAMVGVAVLLAQLLVVRSLARTLSDVVWVPALAMAGTAFTYSLMYWTLRGMEVGLIALVITSAAYLATRLSIEWRPRLLPGLAFLLTAAVFTRDDAAVAVLAICGTIVIAAPSEVRLRVASGVAGFLLLLAAARLGLRQVMYDEWLPNTYYLKVSDIPRTLLLERGTRSLGYAAVFGLAVPTAVAMFAYVGARGRRLLALCMLGAIVLGQVAYTAAVGGDAWEQFGFANRFLASITGPLMVLAAVGAGVLATGDVLSRRGAVLASSAAGSVLIATLLFAIGAPRNDAYFVAGEGGSAELAIRVGLLLAAGACVAISLVTRRGWAVGIVVALVVLAPNVIPFAQWTTSNYHERDWDIAAARQGMELRRDTKPRASIATPAIGNIGYFSNRRIIDVLGKIDPLVARTPPHLDAQFRAGHVRWDYKHSYRDLRPDVLANAWVMTPDEVSALSTWGYAPRSDDTFLLVREGGRVRAGLRPSP